MRVVGGNKDRDYFMHVWDWLDRSACETEQDRVRQMEPASCLAVASPPCAGHIPVRGGRRVLPLRLSEECNTYPQGHGLCSDTVTSPSERLPSLTSASLLQTSEEKEAERKKGRERTYDMWMVMKT